MTQNDTARGKRARGGARPRRPRRRRPRRVSLRGALRATPGEPHAVLGLGSLALIRHEFREALVYGRRAERLLPGSARPFGVIGDALVELGRYDQAFEAFEKMVSLRPNLASYVRIAYARELTGDRIGALATMQLALEAAAGQPEPTACEACAAPRHPGTRSSTFISARLLGLTRQQALTRRDAPAIVRR